MMQSFDDAGRLTREFMDAGLESLAAVSTRIQAATVEAVGYSKKSVEDGAAVLEELASAGSLERAVQVHGDYSRQAYQGFVAQATKMNELFADMAKEACRPFESSFGKTK